MQIRTQRFAFKKFCRKVWTAFGDAHIKDILTKQTPESDTSFHVVLGWDRELDRLTGEAAKRP